MPLIVVHDDASRLLKPPAGCVIVEVTIVVVGLIKMVVDTVIV
jgi:hypothetical protein